MINELQKVDFLATMINRIPDPDLKVFESFYHQAKTVRKPVISTVL
jgi:hypothetical protein